MSRMYDEDLCLSNRVRNWINDSVEDWYSKYLNRNVIVRTIAWKVFYYTGVMLGWSCRFVGHEPVPDGCGMPHHDYCNWCWKPTPDLSDEEYRLIYALELDEQPRPHTKRR